MRVPFRAWLAGVACAAAVTAGCSKLETCNVSPIEIEELREDISIIDKDLAGVNDRAQQLSDDLAGKQADLNSKKDRPAELRSRLEVLKRGSGRIEKEKKAADAGKPASKGGARSDKESS